MTKRQRADHKAGNQIRKLAIMDLAKNGKPPERRYWATSIIIQNGKFAPKI